MILTLRFICCLVKEGEDELGANFFIDEPPVRREIAESCADNPLHKRIENKKLSNGLTVQVSDTTEAGLCTEVGFIRTKIRIWPL